MAEREEVKCKKCGGSFSRSVFHPYIVLCPGCRGTVKKANSSASTGSTKGKKLSRVEATCEKCGKPFNRSVAHPYIVRCPECRNTRKGRTLRQKRAWGCVFCKDHLHKGEHKPGMHVCLVDTCQKQYWLYGNGWWRTWENSEKHPTRLFYRDVEVATLDGTKTVKELMSEYQK